MTLLRHVAVLGVISLWGVAAAIATPVPPVPPPPPVVAADAVVATAPPPPDYADPANWAAGPGGPGAGAALPDGATPAAREPLADVFYIHPTTFRGGQVWNQNVADPAANKWVDASAVARQASPFSGCCRVFAPRYRAASYGALMNPAMRDKAFALAYSDVDRAFTYYLAHYNHGRPFIIAGHSQGAFHAATLLERRLDGTVLGRRMVAAYIVGMNLGVGEFGMRFHDIAICARPDQTRCAVQWNSLLDGSDLAAAAAGAQSTYVARYGDNAGKTTLCINPVTFDARRPASLSAEAKGTVPGAPGFGAMRPLRAGVVAARCDHGMLVVDLAPGLGMDPLAGTGVMHYHDIGLFWADIRANAGLRVRAYVAAHGAGNRR